MNEEETGRRLSIGAVRRSYGLKLALALLSVVALTVAFGTLVHFQTSEQLQNDVREELTMVSELRANELDTWVSGIKTQTRATSTRPVFEGGDTDRIKSHLDAMVERGRVPEGVAAVHYLDTEEMTIVTSSADELVGVSPREQGAAFATDPPAFDGSDDVYVTKPFEVPVVEFPVVAVISPVEGRENRAVVYMVNFEQRTQSFTESVDGGYTAVVNADGEYIAHPDTSEIGTSHEGSVDFAAVFADGSDFTDASGTLLAASAMESKDWAVVVNAPRSQAYALGSQVTSSILGLILLAVVSLALIGVTIGSNTVISLRQLSKKADEMASGDLQVELETKRTDEIGTLFASFADLRDSLSRKIAETEDARQTAEQARREAEQARKEAEAQREEAETARRDAEEMNVHLERQAEHYEDVMRACADGDLSRRVEPDSRSAAMTAIGEAFNQMVAELEGTVADLKRFADHVAASVDEVDASAEEVMSASGEVSESVQEISDGARRQSEHLQDVSGEMSDLSARAEEVAATVDSVAETSEQAAQAGQDGREAAEDAVREMDAVEAKTDGTMAAIERLDDEMEAIGDIVEVITDIAGQTNLLALNASIEAARTGEDGDGFAVVADEIKSLAEETKESAEEIEARIERVQMQTAQSVEGMQETSERISAGVDTVENAIESLEQIVEYVEETNTSIQEINDATEGQAESAQSVVEMVDEVAAISEETTGQAENVAAASEEQTATLTEVSASATDLSERATKLRELLAAFEVAQETESFENTGFTSKPVADDD